MSDSTCTTDEQSDAPEAPSPDVTVRGSTMARCACCGKSFKATPRQRERAAEGARVYCSRDCQKGDVVVLDCAGGCGEQVRRRRSEVPESGRVFCSTDCRNKNGVRPRTGIEKPCEACGKKFYVIPASVEVRRTCSRACKNDLARRNQVTSTCDFCGKSYTRAASAVGQFCSRRCYLDDRVGSGSGWINEDGYRCISQGSGKPALLEHRVIMAKLLGRNLARNENIHHINGVRHDNTTNGPLSTDPTTGRLRSGNLELWNTSQPAGQDVMSKLAHARQILALYGTEAERTEYASSLPPEVVIGEVIGSDEIDTLAIATGDS